MTHLAMIVLTWMVSLQDPSNPGFVMTPAWAASYPETAQEFADAATKNPIAELGVEGTAALLTIWSQHESRFKRDAKGDNGSSLGLLQVSRFWEKGYGLDVAGALKLMHKSFEICKGAGKPVLERMGWYAQGSSGCEKRLLMSRWRMTEAERFAKTGEMKPAIYKFRAPRPAVDWWTMVGGVGM
jgi:hypothetical protein